MQQTEGSRFGAVWGVKLLGGHEAKAASQYVHLKLALAAVFLTANPLTRTAVGLWLRVRFTMMAGKAYKAVPAEALDRAATAGSNSRQRWLTGMATLCYTLGWRCCRQTLPCVPANVAELGRTTRQASVSCCWRAAEPRPSEAQPAAQRSPLISHRFSHQ
jgi:hypothetical protein